MSIRKTLEEQFKNIKPPSGKKDGMKECNRINNFQVIQIIRYIIQNECALEHRNNLDSDDWKPGTIRQFLYWVTQAGVRKYKTIDQFDTWMLNFWRIKTDPTPKELYDLTHIENKNED